MKKEDEETGEFLGGEETHEKLFIKGDKFNEEGRARIMQGMRGIIYRNNPVRKMPYSFSELNKDELIQYIGYCHEILKEAYPRLLQTVHRRKKGTQATQQQAEKRYQKAKEIFFKLEKKGEELPIKKFAIQKAIEKYWAKGAPGGDTLFSYQKRYLLEKRKG